MNFTEGKEFYFKDIKCHMVCTRPKYNALECNSLEPNFKDFQMTFEFNDKGMNRTYHDPHIQKSYNEQWGFDSRYNYHQNGNDDGFFQFWYDV